MRPPWCMAAHASFQQLYLILTFTYVKMVFCYLFHAKLLKLTRSKRCIMAGVLEKLLRQQKKAIYRSTKALELESAKAILAEVFHVRPSVVEDMIQSRLEDKGGLDKS